MPLRDNSDKALASRKQARDAVLRMTLTGIKFKSEKSTCARYGHLMSVVSQTAARNYPYLPVPMSFCSQQNYCQW